MKTKDLNNPLFKDRVEIVSPGGLPAGMTEADLGIKSISRNPLLFSLLHRMEAVENIGSGKNQTLWRNRVNTGTFQYDICG